LETVTSTANLQFDSQAFELNAYQGGNPVDNFTLEEPATITITYTHADVTGINEESLILFYWDESSEQWVDAASTCTPTSIYNRHPEANWLAVAICYLSQFAMFGEQQATLFLPLVKR
jgi:hypothetical protein